VTSPSPPAREASPVPYRQIVECAGEGVWVVDRDDRTTYVNAKLAAMLGYRPDEMLGTRLAEHLDEPHRTLMRATDLARAHAGGELEVRMLRADGSGLWAHMSTSPLRDDAGALTGRLSLVTDLTPRRDAEQRAQESQRALAEAQAIAQLGSWEWNVLEDTLTWSVEMCRIYGVTPDGFVTDYEAFLHRVHPDDRDEVARVVSEAFQQAGPFDFEHRIVRPDGEIRVLQARGEAIAGLDGRVLRMLGTGQDITERKESERRLQYLADHDPLTGLMNRRRFVEELERQIDFGDAYERPGALLLLDLDHFKLLNDTLGHSAGDEVISSVARTLHHRLRRADTLARLGGDEFAVLLPGASAVQARAVAETLRETVTTHRMRGVAALTASIGITTFDAARRLRADDLLVEADVAMYEAKEAGRNRIAHFERGQGHAQGVRRRLTWTERIRQALEDDRLVLHAQPIFDVRSGEVAQYELLLRMRASGGMLFKPATFMHVAERFGLVRAVDRWVIRAAADLLADERMQAPVAVNLSADSLSDERLPEYVERTLARVGAAPERLTLEVTETVAIANLDQARRLVGSLSQLGCRFALDDFGAGFGSFYYLKYLPFDYLKIDGEFIRDLASNSIDQLLVRALVETARGLGNETVAEFVGSGEVVDCLRELGVDRAQGYHLGRPRPIDEILARQL
jgi:diguanylate cyclase (GGDEF)-like protein/PAS domain S-box-containing protein